MRFTPKNLEDFDRASPGDRWRELSGVGLRKYLALGIPLGLALAIASFFAWGSIAMYKGVAREVDFDLNLFVSIPVLFLLHELFHIVAAPCFGLSNKSIVGFDRKWFVFFVFYTDPIGRERYIFSYLLPLLAITIVPMIYTLISGEISGFVVFLSIANAFVSFADVIGSWVLLTKVPRGSLILHRSLSLYWKKMA